jgi:hypothetical protein
MTIQNERQLQNTRAKLERLESRYRELLNDTQTEDDVRELSLESLAGLINPLNEEIAWFESRQISKA